MPGITGFIAETKNPESILFKMQDSITHKDFYVKDKCFYSGTFACTRSHINTIQKEKQPFQSNGVCIWLDGEFYNQQEIIKKTDTSRNDLAILYKLYKNTADFSFLRAIDGIFSAVILDKIKRKVYLITDRYGLKHLYWSKMNGRLAWASEVKAFLYLPWINPTVNIKSVNDFFSIGYILGDRTWLKDVYLIPSGTIITYDLDQIRIEKSRYWWWSDIKLITGKINANEIADEIGHRLVSAVKKRCRTNEKVGLNLSGGLDSRAILAAMPEREDSIHAITFGKKGCEDIRIAAMAANLKGARHHIFEIDDKNWIAERFPAVWWSDGQLNLMHMHGVKSILFSKKFFDININGFLGDALLGGSYIGKNTLATLDKFENRGRKFINLGPRLVNVFLDVRLPFFDNALMELTMSIPERYRKNSYIYNKALLKTFKNFYEKIPWEKTGYPISIHPYKVAFFLAIKKLHEKILLLKNKNPSAKFISQQSYTMYNSWLRKGTAVKSLNNILFNKNAIYPEYISKEKVVSELTDHLNLKADYSDNLCRYLTFEIWLQRALNLQNRHHNPKT